MQVSDEKLRRYERFSQGNFQVLYHQSTLIAFTFQSVNVLQQVAGCITYLRNMLAEDLIGISPVIMKLVESMSSQT